MSTLPEEPASPKLPRTDAFDFAPLTFNLLSRLATTGADSGLITRKYGAPVEVKDVDTEASRIRLKIQKARATVMELPDMNRSIQEQETEIQELQTKIRRQGEVLEGIRKMEAVQKAAQL